MCPIWAVRPKCEFFENWNVVWTNYNELFLRNRLHFVKFQEPIIWFCRSGLKQQVSISADQNRETEPGRQNIFIQCLVVGQNLVYSNPFTRSLVYLKRFPFQSRMKALIGRTEWNRILSQSVCQPSGFQVCSCNSISK